MNQFLTDGYQIIPQSLDRKAVIDLRQAVADAIKPDSDYGVREVHRQISLVEQLANSKSIAKIISEQTNYTQFRLIKAIYFNKNAERNWSVPWHQDKTIAVKQRVMLPGFKNWTVKKGVPHVQPPLDVLAKITTMRIAIDDANASNGGLKILPRTHKLGVLNRAEIEQIIRRRAPLSLNLKAGDIVLLHPLILHASNKSIDLSSRRTVHLEYSSGDLP